jgi:hypothetical protein
MVNMSGVYNDKRQSDFRLYRYGIKNVQVLILIMTRKFLTLKLLI